MTITLTALPFPQACGDWHDKPVKWQVTGPCLEVQKFSTKKAAQKYASFRRRSETQRQAVSAFVRAS